MWKKRLGNTPSAVGEMFDFLRLPGVQPHETLRALQELQAIAPDRLPEALNLPAVQSLDDSAMLDVFNLTWNTLEAHNRCIKLLSDRIFKDGNSEIRDNIFELSDRLIKDRRWPQAILLLETRPLEDLYPAEAFYLAMAYWGKTGNMPEHLCRLALDGFESTRNTADLNEEPSDVECWLLWGVGRASDALHLLDRAIESVEKNPDSVFSYWRCATCLSMITSMIAAIFVACSKAKPCGRRFSVPRISPLPVDGRGESP